MWFDCSNTDAKLSGLLWGASLLIQGCPLRFGVSFEKPLPLFCNVRDARRPASGNSSGRGQGL